MRQVEQIDFSYPLQPPAFVIDYGEPLLLLSFRRASMSSLCELHSFFFSLLLEPLQLLAVGVAVAPVVASLIH